MGAIAFPGDTDTHTFLTYVQQVLVPNLWHGACIEAAGARLVYLSPYSPEFSPIENYWSKSKEYLRSQAARTYQALDCAISAAFDGITTQDIAGWFPHCGYCIVDN